MSGLFSREASFLLSDEGNDRAGTQSFNKVHWKSHVLCCQQDLVEGTRLADTAVEADVEGGDVEIIATEAEEEIAGDLI